MHHCCCCKLVARGIPSELRGRKEVQAELCGLLDAAVGQSMDVGWTFSEIETAIARHVSSLTKKARLSEIQLEQNQDLAECLRICMVHMQRTCAGDALKALRSEVGRVFGSSAPRQAVVLSTVHKAKGLEWHTVYILQPFSLPLAFLVDPDAEASGWDEWGREQKHEQWVGADRWGWEQKQEQNVVYVALTRAKSELLFLKHVKGLRDDHHKIVEVFGEEAYQNTEHEHWWDEEQRRGGTFGAAGSGCPDLEKLNRRSAAKLLGVATDATPGEVNAAFKKLAIQWHPDKARGEYRQKTAKVIFPRMLAARDLLMGGR